MNGPDLDRNELERLLGDWVLPRLREAEAEEREGDLSEDQERPARALLGREVYWQWDNAGTDEPKLQARLRTGLGDDVVRRIESMQSVAADLNRLRCRPLRLWSPEEEDRVRGEHPKLYNRYLHTLADLDDLDKERARVQNPAKHEMWAAMQADLGEAVLARWLRSDPATA